MPIDSSPRGGPACVGQRPVRSIICLHAQRDPPLRIAWGSVWVWTSIYLQWRLLGVGNEAITIRLFIETMIVGWMVSTTTPWGFLIGTGVA